MSFARRVLAAAVAALLAVPAAAQTPAPAVAADPEATLVEELVINARAPGPAWWRVSDGDSTVYVLGVPPATPKGLTYDDSLIRRRLDGANVLILPPEARVNPVKVAGLVLGARKLMIADKAHPLPEELRTRLHARMQAMGETPTELDELKPAFAGFIVAMFGEKNVKLHVGAVADDVRDLAKSRAVKKHPKIRKTGGYDVLGAVKALGQLPQAQQEQCLDDGLRQAEAGGARLRATSEAWARGEVRSVVAADRGFQRCLAGLPQITGEIRRGMDASTQAIEEALRKPGKSVALVELRPLLAEAGVLDRLRAKGYEVRVPE